MNYIALGEIPTQVQNAAGDLLDSLIRNDRLFVILCLALLVFMGIIAWISFKRHLKTLDNMETRLTDKQKENYKVVSMLSNYQVELTRSQSINEKLVEVTEQQQKYIESQKEERRLMENMDDKLNRVLVEIAKK